MSIRQRTDKVLVTLPEEHVRVIDGLVRNGAAPTRSALIQQIIGAFVAETNNMHKTPQVYNQPQTIENAFEALIAYFLRSLGKAVIDSLFEGGKK
jgi:metal-responsive CopG/Arc/MetJ family transcriptional regulator